MPAAPNGIGDDPVTEWSYFIYCLLLLFILKQQTTDKFREVNNLVCVTHYGQNLAELWYPLYKERMGEKEIHYRKSSKNLALNGNKAKLGVAKLILRKL